jgi:hypothetical protein
MLPAQETLNEVLENLTANSPENMCMYKKQLGQFLVLMS